MSETLNPRDEQYSAASSAVLYLDRLPDGSLLMEFLNSRIPLTPAQLVEFIHEGGPRIVAFMKKAQFFVAFIAVASFIVAINTTNAETVEYLILLNLIIFLIPVVSFLSLIPIAVICCARKRGIMSLDLNDRVSPDPFGLKFRKALSRNFGMLLLWFAACAASTYFGSITMHDLIPYKQVEVSGTIDNTRQFTYVMTVDELDWSSFSASAIRPIHLMAVACVVFCFFKFLRVLWGVVAGGRARREFDRRYGVPLTVDNYIVRYLKVPGG